MKKKDNSPYIYQRDKITTKLDIKEIPFTEKQKKLIELALDKTTKCVIIKGAAGTTKTFLAVYCALKLLNDHRVSDIMFIRSAIESSDSKLGFLPGTIEEKYSVYTTPFLDKLDELLPKAQIQSLQKDKRLITTPVGYARGCHWAAKAIIIDEAQCLTLNELQTLLTRMGEFSKIFICGDPAQSDLQNGHKEDFNKLYAAFSSKDSEKNGVYTFEFNEEEDILRSEFVKYVIKVFKNIKK